MCHALFLSYVDERLYRPVASRSIIIDVLAIKSKAHPQKLTLSYQTGYECLVTDCNAVIPFGNK
ncbi:hypothetical protein [Psychrobacter fozii]|uniref:hypothetical protein n=1 Tax=Psychrobacter fozii TaxID=198480 RepID=UPI0019184F85|nr:hypothetical protein [Psychrobacter fozii]